MLRVDGLSAWYGEAQALREASLHVDEGEIVTLVGRNGAGKTTLLRCLMGLHGTYGRTSGTITLDGEDVTALPAHVRARRGLGYVPDDRGIYATLSVEENLLLAPVVKGNGGPRPWPLERIYETFPHLKERRRAPGTTLSGGEQQMLVIARALLSQPSLLLLDEPSLGLAPKVVAEMFALIRQLNQEGRTILLVEQNANQALRLAHRAYVMETGNIVLAGPGPDLARDPRVRAAHLGV